jgi:hypothetical protein
MCFNFSKEKKRTKHKQKERNSGNETLLSAVKMKPGKVRSFRTGYHSSSGPTDFLKKKYNSPILEVNHLNISFLEWPFMPIIKQ